MEAHYQRGSRRRLKVPGKREGLSRLGTYRSYDALSADCYPAKQQLLDTTRS